MAQRHPAFELVIPLMNNMMVPGAVVAISTPDYGLQIESFGYRNVERTDPISVDDHFRVGSNTKTMTGTALLQYAQTGIIGIHDPVVSHLPAAYKDNPKLTGVTVAQILDMRSGLGNYSELLSFNTLLDTEPSRVYEPKELIQWGLDMKTDFLPGLGFHYSNTNTCLAGEIIRAKGSHQALREILRDRVFRQAELINTSLPEPADSSIPTPHPKGYMYGTNVKTIKSYADALTPDERVDAYAGRLLPNPWTDCNPSWTWAAGGVISTARDLVKYVEKLVKGGLLDEDMQQLRIQSVRPPNANAGADSANEVQYGLALAKFGPMYGHDGTMPGFQSFMGHDLDTGNTLVVLTNLTASPAGEEPANELAKAIIPKL